MSSFNFEKIIETQYIQLQEILLKRIPKSAQLYNVLQIYLNSEIKIGQSFFLYNGLKIDITCIATKVETENRTYWIILGPTEMKSMHEIMESFDQIVNWEVDNSFNAVDDDIFEYLKELCVKHKGYRPTGPGVVYYMPLEEALQIDLTLPLPQGAEVRQLTPEDMTTVYTYWKFADDSPDKDLITESATSLASIGLVLNGTLVSWGVDMMDGGIHAVHTLEEYRGCGFGKIVMKHLCHSVAKKCGQFPLVHIETDNKVSIAFMESLGFKYSHIIHWTEYDGISTRKQKSTEQ